MVWTECVKKHLCNKLCWLLMIWISKYKYLSFHTIQGSGTVYRKRSAIQGWVSPTYILPSKWRQRRLYLKSVWIGAPSSEIPLYYSYYVFWYILSYVWSYSHIAFFATSHSPSTLLSCIEKKNVWSLVIHYCTMILVKIIALPHLQSILYLYECTHTFIFIKT